MLVGADDAHVTRAGFHVRKRPSLWSRRVVIRVAKHPHHAAIRHACARALKSHHVRQSRADASHRTRGRATHLARSPALTDLERGSSTLELLRCMAGSATARPGPLDMMVQREPGAPRASDVDIAVARPPAVPRASESAPAASHSAGLRAPESAMRPSIHSGQIARVPPGGAESPGGEPGLGQQLRPPPAGAC